MGDNLNRLPQIISSPLTLNHMLVDLPGCDIMIPSQGDIQISLIISQIKVCFSAIIEDENFSVLCGGPAKSKVLRNCT
jgi:hypothetical protein